MQQHGGVHSMLYSYDFQVIIACGYSTNIFIFNVHPTYKDTTLAGLLTGHTSMLTTICMMGTSPTLCSGDDVGSIRLWNIKTFQCVQCLNYGRKTLILKILDISSKHMMSFLGSRVNVIKLDNRNQKKFNDNYPTRIEFNPRYEELLITTKKELIFIDVNTGRAKRIFGSLLPEEEDEIV
jgi:WD40 repeat protein